MRAVVQDRYGAPDAVLQVREVDAPAPGRGEVLVRVRAASVHPDIWHYVTGLPYAMRLMGIGVRTPRIKTPGTDLAGRVESIGTGVVDFKVGDEVFGESSLKLFGYGGTYAEYVAVPQGALAIKPRHATFEQAAAAATSGSSALLNLAYAGRLDASKHVLINGAGGCVGGIAVQIVKATGARVTGVDCTEKLELMRALGADEVVDYTTERVLERRERYDFILDVATTLSFTACKRALTPNGLYWATGHGHYCADGKLFGSVMLPFGTAVRLPFDRQSPKLNFKVPGKRDTMTKLKGLLESGALAPIVARTFPLSEVPAAIRCVQEGRTPGRVVVSP